MQRLNITIIKIYADRAKSAKTDNRPGFQRMVKDSFKKAFSYVIVYTLDRFSRSRYDSVIYKAKLKKNGVRVLSAKENIKDDPSGIILESVLEGYVEYFSAELAQKVKRGMTENILEKKWPGTPVPFGYKKRADGRLKINPLTAPAVKKMYEMMLSGRSMAEITRTMQNKGYVNPTSGKPLRYQVVYRILHNQIYTGAYIWNGTEIKDFAPAIIPITQWEAVQRMKKTRNVRRNNAINYMLTGKLICGICGLPMTGTCGTSKNGHRHYYYRCSSKNNKIRGVKARCDSKPIPVDKLESLVYDVTIAILNQPKYRKEIARQAAAVQEDKTTQYSEGTAINAQIRKIQGKLNNSISAIEAGVFSETIKNNIISYEKQIKELKKQLAKLKMVKSNLTITESAIEFFFEKMLEKARLTDSRDLNVFFDFINRVVVYKSKIEIYYNYTSNIKIPNPAIIEGSGNGDVVSLKGTYTNIRILHYGFVVTVANAA